uniref:Snf7 family protein n=1 Tax=Ignisphaera aggregans TaxID=334771 RepID=A0A7C2V9T4_9CREN
MSIPDFEKRWGGSPTVGEKLKDVFKRKEPLKQKLVMSNYKIRTLVSRLEVFIERLRDRDRTLFERVVDALMQGDETRAAMYANEIAEIRKLVKQLTVTQVALEQVALRIDTVLVTGDVLTGLIPVAGVIKELRGVLRGLMPEMSLELQEIEEGLRDVVISTGEVLGAPVGDIYASPEARRILEEARIVAEQKMKEKFPELPMVSSVAEKSSAPTTGTA